MDGTDILTTDVGNIDVTQNSQNETQKASINSTKNSSWKDHVANLSIEEDLSHLSKNKQKKLLKRKLYQSRRLEKRKEEREKKKVKRQELKKAGLPLPQRSNIKAFRLKEPCSQNIVIDLGYANLMNDCDLRMLLKQVKTCYAQNRKMKNPAKFHLTSFNGAIKDLFTMIQPGCVNWTLNFHEESYLEKFDKNKIVYLTADSENVLETLNDQDVYIIGGLVDHNQQKGLSHRLAVGNSIRHACLPITEYIKLNTRRVLTVNHVFEILAKYIELNDWKDAFFQVIPRRKINEITSVVDKDGKIDDVIDIKV